MPTAGERQAAADVLAKAKARTASCDLVLDGDLVAEHEDLSAHLDTLQKKSKDSPEAVLLSEQIVDLEARMKESEVHVVFRGMGRGRWRKLMADYPPKPEHAAAGAEFDVDEFPFHAIAACLLEPAWSVEELKRLYDEVLTEIQFGALWAACLRANLGGASNRPESQAAHAIAANGRHKSAQPSDSESAAAS